MTWYGIWYYGLQLTLLETSTLGAVYMLKLIIDYLQAELHTQNQGLQLFLWFTGFRLI
jgi:hypothetical protein